MDNGIAASMNSLAPNPPKRSRLFASMVSRLKTKPLIAANAKIKQSTGGYSRSNPKVLRLSDSNFLKNCEREY